MTRPHVTYFMYDSVVPCACRKTHNILEYKHEGMYKEGGVES